MCEKPIIRHCRNCKWSKPCFMLSAVRCEVKYKSVYDDTGRITATFCKYFTAGSSSKEV